jgi:hypothetical protein
MAIYINDKVLKANPTGTKIEQEYYEGLKKVSALFERFRNKNSKTSYIQVTRKEEQKILSINTKKVKRLPTIALPVEIPYYDDEIGATTIRYATSNPIKNQHGNFTWATKYIDFQETLTITDKQKDLAWFLLFASNLIKKGIYQLVDSKAKYEGTYNEIIQKNNVIQALDKGDEELVRHIARMFINDDLGDVDKVAIIVKLNTLFDARNIWGNVWDEIKKYKAPSILKKENISGLKYNGDDVQILECPEFMKMTELRADALSLGIKLTTPPQTKDVLYSIIQHVRSKKSNE